VHVLMLGNLVPASRLATHKSQKRNQLLITPGVPRRQNGGATPISTSVADLPIHLDLVILNDHKSPVSNTCLHPTRVLSILLFTASSMISTRFSLTRDWLNEHYCRTVLCLCQLILRVVPLFASIAFKDGYTTFCTSHARTSTSVHASK